MFLSVIRLFRNYYNFANVFSIKETALDQCQAKKSSIYHNTVCTDCVNHARAADTFKKLSTVFEEFVVLALKYIDKYIS